MTWKEDLAQQEFDALRSNDPRHKMAELQMSWVSEDLKEQCWLFSQFLEAIAKNTVVTTFKFSSRGMDERRMHVLADLFSKKPGMNMLRLDIRREEPAEFLSAFFSQLSPRIEFIRLHMNTRHRYKNLWEVFAPVEDFFATATKLTIVGFYGQLSDNCPFETAVVRGISVNPTVESIVWTEPRGYCRRPLPCLAHLEGTRLVTAVAHRTSIKKHGVRGIFSTFVRLDNPAFVYIGEPNNCSVVEWRKVGVDDGQSLARSERSFRVFLKRLASNEQRYLRAMGLDEECQDAVFGCILAQYVSELPHLVDVYEASAGVSGSKDFDMSRWEPKDKHHVLRCLGIHKVMDTPLVSLFCGRNSRPSWLLCADLPSSLWPNILHRTLRPRSWWASIRAESYSSVYCLLREANSVIVPRH